MPAVKIPAAYQVSLIELAMEAASAIPVEPHIKDRCRTQEQVVAASLQLDMFKQAEAFTGQIKDWRRGSCLADLALYQAMHGEKMDALNYMEKAKQISEAQGLEEWRRDAIRVKMAQAHLWLENDREAAGIVSGLSPADAGKVAGANAMRGSDAGFEEQFKAFMSLSATGEFDTASAGLQSALQLHERFYDNGTRRTLIENTIRGGWGKVPIFMRLEIVLRLSDAATGHKDDVHALALLDEAEGIRKSAKWPIEYETPLAARLAECRYRAGDRSQAQSRLEAALAKYDKDKELMLNIERVGALLPVAEAYVAIGDRAGALGVYRRTCAESVVNSNSRPRAMDLSAICRSMAVHGFEPDAALWDRLREIGKELSDPW